MSHYAIGDIQGCRAEFRQLLELIGFSASTDRLWLVAERYRLLLAEVNDNLVDGPALLDRRNELVAELDSIYQFAFGVDHAALRVTW